MTKEPTQAQREHMHNSALEEVYSAVYDAGLLGAVLTEPKFLEKMVEALRAIAEPFDGNDHATHCSTQRRIARLALAKIAQAKDVRQ